MIEYIISSMAIFIMLFLFFGDRDDVNKFLQLKHYGEIFE